VYGFHRAMDHAGAVIGPTLASVFLFFYPGEYRTLFALTIVPGAIAVALIFFVSEADTVRLKPDTTDDRAATPSRISRPTVSQSSVVSGFSGTDRALPREFTMFMLVLTLFTLGNSTDAFLLLKLTDAAGSVRFIPLMWAALHVVKAGVSVVGGSWSDRVGRRSVIAIGWLIYAAVYAGFALSQTLTMLIAWFLVYGFYFGFAEGTEKALVADLAPASRRGFAFGIYTAVQGVGALAASVLFGVIWNAYGAATAFGVGATLALVATGLLFAIIEPLHATDSGHQR
jgi:MFS family permease